MFVCLCVCMFDNHIAVSIKTLAPLESLCVRVSSTQMGVKVLKRSSAHRRSHLTYTHPHPNTPPMHPHPHTNKHKHTNAQTHPLFSCVFVTLIYFYFTSSTVYPMRIASALPSPIEHQLSILAQHCPLLQQIQLPAILYTETTDTGIFTLRYMIKFTCLPLRNHVICAASEVSAKHTVTTLTINMCVYMQSISNMSSFLHVHKAMYNKQP